MPSRSKLSCALEIVLSHNTFSAHFLNLLVFCLRLWFVIVCFMDISLCVWVCLCVCFSCFFLFVCLFCSNLVPLFFIVFMWGWIDGEVGEDLEGDEGEKFMIMTYRTEKIHFQFLKERGKKPLFHKPYSFEHRWPLELGGGLVEWIATCSSSQDHTSLSILKSRVPASLEGLPTQLSISTLVAETLSQGMVVSSGKFLSCPLCNLLSISFSKSPKFINSDLTGLQLHNLEDVWFHLTLETKRVWCSGDLHRAWEPCIASHQRDSVH